MSWSCTHVAELPDIDNVGGEDDQPWDERGDAFVQRAAGPAPGRQARHPEKPLPEVCPSRKIVPPRLHHFGLTTSNLEAMVDWYAKLLDTEPNHRPSKAVAGHSVSRWRTVWIGNDQASHRIAIMALPALTADPQRSRHQGLHHVAFAFANLDDLLATYARLKLLGIEPVRAADHGATISFYYEDPDRNSIELMVDNVAAAWESKGFKQSSPANSMGTDVDPEQLLAARAAGMSVAELHEGAYGGEFCSANGFYRHCLLTAAASRSAAG